jgi:hypothetical protein
MNRTQFQGLRIIEEMASPGPWLQAEGVIRDRSGRVVARMGGSQQDVTFQDQADGELIVALRNIAAELDSVLDSLTRANGTIERLVARVRRLEAQRYGP